MATRVRTINFLPEIFQTKTNTEFLSATLDQLVNPPLTNKIQGYIGSKFGYGVNADDYYIPESTPARTNYQLDPGVVFTRDNSSKAQDFISYPGILDALQLDGAITDDNNRLFESEIYSWDSFVGLDKVINYNQYYWLPDGAPAATVSSSIVYTTNDYVVTDLANVYNIRELTAGVGASNPTITLLRGGSYNFIVNQPGQFWIQTDPGTSGFKLTQPNISTREVFGVVNNGANQGVVTFNVPTTNSQSEFNFPNNTTVDVISDLSFNQVNGRRLSDLGSIDGITSLENLTVLFYNNIPDEVGFVSSYFDEENFDVLFNPLVSANITVGDITSGVLTLSSGNTSTLEQGKAIIFTGGEFGTIQPNVFYYVVDVINSTQFTITDQPGNPALPLANGSGSMTAITNPSQYESGFYTTVRDNFYTVTYVGDPQDPVIRLIPASTVPLNTGITAIFGTTWINRSFYKEPTGDTLISLIPIITANLDQLYYQDGTSPNKVGIIRIIDSNDTNTINVEVDILGKKNYTSANDVVFTNGLKVKFDGDIIPTSYKTGEYYIEGVGTSIELIPVESLIVPEKYGTVEPDYITISRNSINNNAWSRSNRWFHIAVIRQTAIYNNDQSIVTEYATANNKAKRPILEFYPNLKLFDSGVIAKSPIDFIDRRTEDAFSEIVGLERYYPDVEVYTQSTANIQSVTGTTTTITVPTDDIIGEFIPGQYISDYLNILPDLTQIIDVQDISGTTELTVEWPTSTSVSSASDIVVVACTGTMNNFQAIPGSRIVFANDLDPQVKSKIYVVGDAQIDIISDPVIALTTALDGQCFDLDQTVITKGFNDKGNSVYFSDGQWKIAQQKLTVNQPPLFDVLDNNGISFGNSELYTGTSFSGNKLFAYGIGSGTNDPILGFPIRYSSINNVGDISFDVSLNKDTFTYVSQNLPITQKVNTGYVFNYKTRDQITRELGWQTAVAQSVQYQVFNFEYVPTGLPTAQFVCDVSALPEEDQDGWARVELFVDNDCQCATFYNYTTTDNTTTVTFTRADRIKEPTVIQILVLSNQVSKNAYYSIPVNLSNNPFNEDLETVNVGDIRGHYRDIFVNAGLFGTVFGSNNYRDRGNLVPFGSKIIQNSASLVLPGTFLRKKEHNLFDALQFNSDEYVNFKNLLVTTIDNIAFSQRFMPSNILDQAMDIITAAKGENQSFFWSDMLPAKSPLIENTYTFANNLTVSSYPLSKIYNFDTANYDGLLVYLLRTTGGLTVERQLIKDIDYVVSVDSPNITITIELLPEDKITIKEYNQTYGSFVPNTPTKLGMYPSYLPTVILDSAYSQPTYFILGHDGSYNRLYGEYDPQTGILEDFRDQGLLEFEKRIYNNLKLGNGTAFDINDFVPGFFRDTKYTYEEFIQIYTPNFLNWIGKNRLNYKTQVFNRTNEFTFNYTNSANKLTNSPIQPGNWRGVYEYFYDTTTPDVTPWQLLGFTDQPSWWTDRYGPAPYTSDNLVMWNDLANGFVWNNGDSYIDPTYRRPGLTSVIPVDSAGNLVSPFISIVSNYNPNTFQRDWKVGDLGPVELSYRRSSSYPFDLIKIAALMQPAKVFNLAVDLDNYRYSTEFNQYLVDNRSHLVIENIEIYGNGIAKTSYINWIVDFEKQLGINATSEITRLLNNLDVRLVYRIAGYSDKDLLKFFVEKSTPNSNNASLLIPDESYSVLLYDNQPFDKITYSSVAVQKDRDGYTVFGNSQTTAYFKILRPITNGSFRTIDVETLKVRVATDYSNETIFVPYGTKFYSEQEVAQFLMSYGQYLKSSGMTFNDILNGVEINWDLMVGEFLYWSQIGWQVGSIVNLNPSADTLKIDRPSAVVQPLTIQRQNFVLNQNLYPIQAKDMSVFRDGTLFSVTTLNQGDTVAYGQFDLSNFEHGVVFDNTTLFNDVIYNLTTGLRQSRIYTDGTKTAEWNGTVNASGFILNQDNIKEWSKAVKYTKGSIVLYKNKYWTAIRVVEASQVFDESSWKETNYDDIQKGLLPNPSTRSYESALYYDTNRANFEKDADLLSFSLIGYRPRDYLALVDLTDITQINVYKNLIKNKGTRNAVESFKGANLPQGGIDYEVYENWAIKTSEYGGTLNKNFIDFRLNQDQLTGNPGIVSLTNGIYTEGSQQEVPLYNLFNYNTPVNNPNILSVLPTNTPDTIYPSAGYVNFEDVKLASYEYNGLPFAQNENGEPVSINDFYVNDYAWLAKYKENWDVLTWKSIGQVIAVRSNINDTGVVTFNKPHGLKKDQPLSIINYRDDIDGYYTVINVISLTEVVIDLVQLLPLPTTGNGIGLTFISKRIKKPSDVANLDFTATEFSNNTLWVDEAADGSWAVYKKQFNYKFDTDLTKPISETFGTQVLYTPQAEYIISDAAKGEVHRYTRSLAGAYFLLQTLSGGPSFGKSITNADDIFVISEPTGNSLVHIYRLVITNLVNELQLIQSISAPSGVTEWGNTVEISCDGNWLYVSTDDTSVYVYQLSNGTYKEVYVIDGTTLGLTTSDNFGKSISTTYYGDQVYIGAPNEDLSVNIQDWGKVYGYTKSVQNFEVQFTGSQSFVLAWPESQHTSITGTAVSSNYITASGSMTSFAVDDAVIFSGGDFGTTGLQENRVYYIEDISGSTFTVKETRDALTPVTLDDDTGLSFGIYVQTVSLIVTVNGRQVNDNNYAVVDGNILFYTESISIGDILQVSGNQFTLQQTFISNDATRPGNQYGTSVDNTKFATELLIGSPFEITEENQEGVVYRWTNAGKKYGIIIGISDCNVTTNRVILLNGYQITIPAGNSDLAAQVINGAQITNIMAASQDNKLIIQLTNQDLAIKNQALTITSPDPLALSELGIQVYTNTQLITSPHKAGPTQFGSVIKFNESDSVAISAPVATRYSGTSFDNGETIFDNNATGFVDTSPNAGAVYVFDYFANYLESIFNPGSFAYSQSVNSITQQYGFNPLYGTSLYFSNNVVMIGAPLFLPEAVDGMVTIYQNPTGLPSWSIVRQSAPIVDINAIENIQLYSAENNTTLSNMDYIDPLQGKLLGSARQNIDYVSNVDPAAYNIDEFIDTRSGMLWAAEHVGTIWFDTINVKFVNYHQNDVVYNSKWWGQVFPDSDVAIYSWIESSVIPNDYTGPGVPRDINQYTVSTKTDASNNEVPVYYFWVRNTNEIFTQLNKTLSDTIIEQYIRNPRRSGITYFAPLLPNTYALYNAQEYINARDTVLHIGYANGTNDDEAHSEYSLIRQDFGDDFLPGVPRIVSGSPEGLYDRMLDSLAGADEIGNVIPNPFLPATVQSGILARPRQTMFRDRYGAIKNYLSYANQVLSQFPIVEIKTDLGLLYTKDEFFDTTDYWEFTNWWALGYDDSIRTIVQVPQYNNLFELDVANNSLATVETNGEGKKEYYRYDGNQVWTRIGLENGTIRFKEELWDYSIARIGFGDNFFDNGNFDEWPSEETRYIIRALTEQIYTNELIIFRNKSLILLFEYIQSESIEFQNYLPWLNKTSLIDVEHKIRELIPLEIFQTDNQEFLEGYVNEVKPYRVVIKDFLFKYTGTDVYNTVLTDFDLPAQYNKDIQTFVSPQLVYDNENNQTTYLSGSNIWQTPEYANWFANRGVTITGQQDYSIDILAGYIDSESVVIPVKSIQGFPINGVIQIGQERIAYSVANRLTGVLEGVTRGIQGTVAEPHIPGEQIIMDLDPVIVLNGGRGYSFVPRVTAYIDLENNPAPIKEAELEPIMALDTVVAVRVIDPGQGYSVLPEIRIEPLSMLMFSNTSIDSELHTISLFAPNLQTGDLVRFSKGNGSIGVDKLQDNQWYYVNVLEIIPTSVVALYTNLSDAMNDANRIEISDIGINDQLSLNLGAKASAVTQAYPIRENNITLRFDRTSYTSKISDWKAGAYYGSFFAGDYTSIASSSSIKLESILPPINSILASTQGVAFEIVSVDNNNELSWSSTVRNVERTISTGNIVRLALPAGTVEENASKSTIGFYVDMPIKFEGAVVGGLVDGQTYYVIEIINDTDFTISETIGGSVLSLTSAVVSVAGLNCFTGQVTDTAILTVNYPGIRQVTTTEINQFNDPKDVGWLTIPLNLSGTGGTSGLYKNMPIFFTGQVFGNIEANDIYYVTTVIDNQRFTMSETPDPLQLTVVSTDGTLDTVTLNTTVGLSVNDPIIFDSMVINDVNVLSFGNIVSGEIYYVSQIIDGETITISQQVNGSVFVLTTVSVAADTNAICTSQANTVSLKTETGSMSINIDYPVSPGQVDGQLFSLYNTSPQYPNITGTNVKVIERNLTATITGVNRIAIDVNDDDTDEFYIDMPIQFTNAPAGSGLSSGTTYYITEFSGRKLNPGIVSPIQVQVTNTSSSGNILTCDTNESLYVNMPIIFSGQGLGGITIGDQYFIDTIISTNQFTIYIKDIDNLPVPVVLTTDNGTMMGTGDKYIQVTDTIGDPNVTITSTEVPSPDPNNPFKMVQEILVDAEFDVSYLIGGYQALVSQTGEGYAISNTILITGNLIGGIPPENDLTLTVNTVDASGGILDVICSGTVPGTTNNYYLKVISDNQFAVYSDPLLQIPVSGIGFNYEGYTTTDVISTTGNTITLLSSDDFVVNDTVTFSGNVEAYGGDIIRGKAYYIIDITGNTIEVSELPGEAAISLPTVTATITMTKVGSFALLPEPFYFDQSIVRFNNRLYVCVISNNDDEFVFGKWQEIRSDDRRLNAMDRAFGYYQPTVNMPGLDLTQLFSGVTYPNSTYYGNPFEPDKQYEIDVALQSNPFSDINPNNSIVDGGQFTLGYSPEELVAGVVSDSFTMVVTTRPGTNWPVDEYGHTGYNVVSVEIIPEGETQTEYSFDNVVQYPAEIYVAVIDGTTGLSTSLYENVDYTIDWINNTIQVSQPLDIDPVINKLRIDVYEVGNGDQLVKSNTKTDPIRLNDISGFNEILLNCNYSALIFAGSGVVRPATFPVSVFATETQSIGNRIKCDDISKFVVNGEIRFTGLVFGGIVENQNYYIKSISSATNTITISETINLSTGIAGPIFEISDDTGLMSVVIEDSPTILWTDPIVYHNGEKLVIGKTNLAIKTSSVTNSITTITTGGIIVGEKIVFCICELDGSGIDPLPEEYYVDSVISSTEFTISETQFGPTKILGNSIGRSKFVTSDYAIDIVDNEISAKIVFANQYDNAVDYLVYSVFGQTIPDQYGYTIPETEIFTADGIEDTFQLSNLVNNISAINAIVEINGLRLDSGEYNIDSNINEITFNTVPTNGDIISVTTYNDTERQFFDTQEIVVTGTEQVFEIANISNAITLPLAVTAALSTSSVTNEITVISTTVFWQPDQTVQFKGTSFDANILTDGTIYFIDTVVDGTTFTIKDESGNQIVLAGGSGAMEVVVGGTPSVRVTTTLANSFAENDIVRIAGTSGSIQLNNNQYYAKIIDSFRFDLYETSYDPSSGAINTPITNVSTYTDGGYTWQSGSYILNNSSGFYQVNPDRLWITVNGFRVPSSHIIINELNEISILTTINTGDVVIMTSMMPYASPDQETYINFVDRNNNPSVYRANTGSRTWLTESLLADDTEIFVDDVNKVTNTLIQNVILASPVNGVYSVGLSADKNLITGIKVFNNTTNQEIPQEEFTLTIIDLSPVIQISDQVATTGDSITITVYEGNIVYINGEQIRFGQVDFINNRLTDIQRGVNGTGRQTIIEKYSTVYSLLSSNKLADVNYNLTWNSNNFNVVDGDPLQISDTVAANFLNRDIL